MLDETKVDGGATTTDSGSADESTTQTKEPIESKKHVPLENHKRALDDMHKFKTRAGELEAKLNAVEEERLKETQNYKSLAEKYKAELEADRKELGTLKGTISRSQKYNALERVALEQGLRTEALDDLEAVNLEDIELEVTSNNRYMVHGTKEFVERLKEKKPHWFKKDKPPGVNSGGGSAKPAIASKLTPDDYVKAEMKYKRREITAEQFKVVQNQYLLQKNN